MQESAVDLPALVRQGASRLGEYLASRLGAVVRNIVVFVFELFVMLFALFYFLRDGDAILDRIRRLLPFVEAMRERMLAETRELIFASVMTGLLVFISVLGGIAVFGALGVVLGPIVVAIAVGVLDVYSGKDTMRDAAGVAE